MSNEDAKLAMQELGKLKGSEAHSTVMLTDEDKNVLRKLGINVTMDLSTSTIVCIVNKLRQTKTIPVLGIVQIEDKVFLKTFLR